jgi:hypothetical protein
VQQDKLKRAGLDSDEEELDEDNLFGSDAGGSDDQQQQQEQVYDADDGAERAAGAATSRRGRLKRKAAAEDEDDVGDTVDDEGLAEEGVADGDIVEDGQGTFVEGSFADDPVQGVSGPLG